MGNLAKKSKSISGLLVCFALIAAACGESEPAAGGEDETSATPEIVVTTSIWGDVVSNVLCDGLANVETLMPTGTNPHTFEVSLADRKALEEADLIVSNGLALEEGIIDTLDDVVSEGADAFYFTDHVNLIEYDEEGHDDEEEGHSDEEEGHGHGHEGEDPHVWLDPPSVAEAIEDLALVLKQDLNLDEAKVDSCVDEYRELILETDSTARETLASIPAEDRELVTNHDAFGYFADEYDLDVIGTVIPSPSELAEANPAELQELADLIKDKEVKAIFAESQHSQNEIDALAEVVGDVEVVTLYSGSLGEPDSGAETYVGYIETNATLIADALN